MYGNQALYMVHAVSVVPRLRKMTQEANNDQKGRRNLQDVGETTFSKILEDAVQKEEPADIKYQVQGYNKNALPFYTVVQMREYTYAAHQA